MILSKLLISNMILFFSLNVLADAPACLQGTAEKNQISNLLQSYKGKDPKNLASIYHAYADAGDNISQLYSIAEQRSGNGLEAIRPLVRKLNVEEDAMNCVGPDKSLTQNVSNIRKVVALSEVPAIKKSCIRSSMMREHGGSEYYCSSSTAKAQDLGSPGGNGSCLTEKMVDYTWWSFHKAIYCLNDPAKPIDPMFIFMKMNNESTFHMQVSSAGGQGIGQLTSPAIAQVKQSGRLDEVINSTNPNCAPFKEALRRSQPGDAKGNMCQMIDPNDGMARNLIYSVSYYLETRDVLMRSFNNALEEAGIEDARFHNMGALAAYGPKGLSIQPQLIEALRASGKNYSKFKEEVRKRITYVDNIAEKADEAVDGAENGVTKLSDCYDPLSAQNR